MSRRSLTLLLVLLVALAGCSAGGLGEGAAPAGGDAKSGGDGGGGGGDGAQRGAPMATEAAGGDATGGGGDAASAAAQARARALIRTGEVRLTVDDFDRARDRLVSVAESRGGFVADSAETTHREDNRTWTEGRLVLRVPSESFTPAFGEVRAVGTVERADSSTEDVTEQLVDLEARLRNLEAQRDRLRTLYEEANDTEDVLRVGRELSEVQGQIERLEAKRRALEDRVALATITVRFSEPRPDQDPITEPAYHETGLGAAFLASVNGAVVAVRTIAVTVAYAVPYLLVFGLPVGLVGFGLYRSRGGRLFDR